MHAGGGRRSAIPERFDLIPPHALREVALAMAEGASRHGEFNWHKLPARVCINHAMRHIILWMDGDQSEPHLSHAAANLLMATELEAKNDG